LRIVTTAGAAARKGDKMRQIKLAAFTCIALTAVIAFTGAGAASANTWCASVPGEGRAPCQTHYAPFKGGVVNVLDKGTKAVLKAGFASLECEELDMKMNLENVGEGESALVKVESFVFGKCNCEEAVALNLTYSGKGNSATQTVTFESGGNGNPGVKIRCSGVTCVYEAGAIVAIFKGGAPAHMKFESTLLRNEKASGVLCSEKGLFTAQTELTGSETMWME
jgi:hypothetical protein